MEALRSAREYVRRVSCTGWTLFGALCSVDWIAGRAGLPGGLPGPVLAINLGLCVLAAQFSAFDEVRRARDANATPPQTDAVSTTNNFYGPVYFAPLPGPYPGVTTRAGLRQVRRKGRAGDAVQLTIDADLLAGGDPGASMADERARASHRRHGPGDKI